MSVHAESDMCKNETKKMGCERNKKSHNSNRRKPKIISSLQNDKCDKRINEIINSLSNAMIDDNFGKMSKDKSSQAEDRQSTDCTLPVNQNCETQRYVVEGTDKRLESCDNCPVALCNDVSEAELERQGNQICKSSASNSDWCKGANLKTSFEESKTKNLLHCKQNVLNKNKLTDYVSHCSEEGGNMKKCVVNRNAAKSQCTVSETYENVICNRSDNFSSDENHKNKYKADKGKKSQRSASIQTDGKSGKARKENRMALRKRHGRTIVIVNSSFNKEKEQTVDKGSRDGNSSKEHSSDGSKSPKGEKMWLTDTKFPKYLTEEEMDSVSRFGILLSGVIRINQKNFQEAYISAPDKGMDILIEGLIDRNRALEGDEVYYVLKGQEHFRCGRDSGEIQRTAAVVAIKNSQHCRGAVGTLKLQDDGSAFFTPRDPRIPRMLIRERDWLPWLSEESVSLDKRLFYAKMKWWNDVRYAEGMLTREVGRVDDIESETSAILLMLELDETPYPDPLMVYLPKIPYKISEKDLSSRRDLRKECIFTVDPASAKDLDDAVSCKRLSSGNYQIGVHISDVTHFLREGSPLDDAISEKATTVYLVQKVYHMLPRDLCGLCSLTPGEDKLTFSVMWEITPELEIVAHDITRSVINSCVKLSYEEAQEILDGSENPQLPELHGGHTVRDVMDSVKMLNSIAVRLRKKRFDEGALRIDQTKIVFSLDEAGLPIAYHVYVNKEAQRLIEEFMLLANITVAHQISSYFPKVAFLRSHSPPQSFMMTRIQKDLEKYGIDLDISSSKALHESLMKYCGSDPQSTARRLVLNTLLAKPMARANYYCSAFFPEDEDKRHYALNVPLYTHFTSPIRRYADVMVHRLLAASLGYSETPNWDPEDVQKIADNCNKKKYAAKVAGEKSTELFLNKYILEKGSLICHGAVCEVKQKFFECILIENGSHQRVYVENMKAVKSVKSEDGIWKITVNWPKNEDQEEEVQVIERFSIVKVQLRKSKEEKNIKAILLRPD